VAANVNMASDFPRHHRSNLSGSRRGADGRPRHDHGRSSSAAGSQCGCCPTSGSHGSGPRQVCPSRCSQRASEPSSCGGIDGVQHQATIPRTSSRFSALGHPVERFPHAASRAHRSSHPVRAGLVRSWCAPGIHRRLVKRQKPRSETWYVSVRGGTCTLTTCLDPAAA
jgi:hypothetical protein